MDQKQLAAVSCGPEWLLTKFVNLPVNRSVTKPAEDFCHFYGELWPGYPPSDYWELVNAFRFHWTAKTEAQKDQLSLFFRKLFSNQIRPAARPDAPPAQEPLLKLDARIGKVTLPLQTLLGLLEHHRVIRFDARSLLDYMVTWLMVFRRQRKLAVCELKGCPQPYFVKSHPRYRYCSPTCGDQARMVRKARWQRENRAAARQAN